MIAILSMITAICLTSVAIEVGVIEPLWVSHWSITDYEEDIILSWDCGHQMTLDEENKCVYVGGWSQYEYFNGDYFMEYVLLKYDLNGNLKWHKALGLIQPEWYGSGGLCEADCYVYVAYRNVYGSIFLLKFDQNGNEEWSRTMNAGYAVDVLSMIVYDNYLYFTLTPSSNDGEVYLYKCNTNDGNLEWIQTWEHDGRCESIGMDLVAYDGFIYLGGHSFIELYERYDTFLCKYDANGNKIWDKTWDGNQEVTTIFSMAIHNNRLFVTGVTGEFPYINSIFLMKFDLDGNEAWPEMRIWNESEEYNILDSADMVIADDHIFISGSAMGSGNSRALLLKYDLDGNLIFAKTWPDTFISETYARRVEAYNERLYLCGVTVTDPNHGNIFLLSCDYNGADSYQSGGLPSSQQSNPHSNPSCQTSTPTSNPTNK